MKPNALLVNTNQYQHPPIPPIGLEYISGALLARGIDHHLLDLCFAKDPVAALLSAIESHSPTHICMSIRNADTVLCPGTEFFLPQIRGMVEAARKVSDAPVIIGGASMAAGAREILDYTGADIAIEGPAEGTLPELICLDDLSNLKGKVIKGRPSDEALNRCRGIDYARYTEAGGIGGFATHYGCSSGCVYCMEASTPTYFRSPKTVATEVKALMDMGLGELHLCDAEFNEDQQYCIEVLKEMLSAGATPRWALYMKPGGAGPALFDLLKMSGAFLITLSVDTYHRGDSYYAEAARMVGLARERGIRICIDLLSGFPGESPEHIREKLDLLAASNPDEIVINTCLRLYSTLAITPVILGDPSLAPFLSVPEPGNLLVPAFYRHISPEALEGITGGLECVKIAGAERGVNYQRGARRPQRGG